MKNIKRIRCEYCGRDISSSNYSKHIRSHKNGNFYKQNSRYKIDHTDLFCKYCGKECKNKNSLIQHEIRCKENKNRINVYIKGFNEGRIAWNKGLTKASSESIKRSSEKYKQNKLLGLHKIKVNPMEDPNNRKKISETCLQKSKNGTWHTSLAKYMHINYKGVDLHGSWELKYAQYLDKNNISWERCKDRFPYEYENNIHYYTPDFFLPLLDKYVEIKGYTTNKDYAKWDQFPKDRTLEILKEKDLLALGIKLY